MGRNGAKSILEESSGPVVGRNVTLKAGCCHSIGVNEGSKNSEVESERKAWVRSPKVLRAVVRGGTFSECQRKPLRFQARD